MGFNAIIDRNCNGAQVHPPDARKSITETQSTLQGKGLVERQPNEGSGTSLKLPL